MMCAHLLSNHVILQLLLKNKVQTKGVIRPLQPEIYVPGVLRSFSCLSLWNYHDV
jgi:hypothetical protein